VTRDERQGCADVSSEWATPLPRLEWATRLTFVIPQRSGGSCISPGVRQVDQGGFVDLISSAPPEAGLSRAFGASGGCRRLCEYA
jgi:hypothetical protein